MTTANVFLPQQGALSDLSNWIAQDLGAAYGRLFTSNTIYHPTNTPASYTEAAFVGYSPKFPLGWSAPFINGMGQAESDTAAQTWSFTAGAGSAIVYGIIVTDVGKTKLLLAVHFINPVILTPGNPNLTEVVQLTEQSLL